MATKKNSEAEISSKLFVLKNFESKELKTPLGNEKISVDLFFLYEIITPVLNPKNTK